VVPTTLPKRPGTSLEPARASLDRSSVHVGVLRRCFVLPRNAGGWGGPLQRKIRSGRGSSGRQSIACSAGSAASFSWGLIQLVFLGLRPPPPQRYPLSESEAALQSLADGGVLGNLVLER
jgi:hypothetical protein